MYLTHRLLFSSLIVSAVCCQINDIQAQTQPRIRPGYGQVRGESQAGGKIVDAQIAQPGQASNRSSAAPVGPPDDFNLTAAQQKRVDEMLKFWEQKTGGIKTFTAKFGRWVYDPVFGPKGDQAAKFSTGEVRYAAADKGMIREDAVYEFDKTKVGEKFPFQQTKNMGEHWVCTGESVFEYDHKAKKLVEIKLPPEMQGKAIAEGPLPFMFGAKAATIKGRYWIREIPQKTKDAPYHLQLLPKLRGENYSLIEIKLDSKKFLPTQMVLHELNKMGRSSYAFKELQANSPKHKVGAFMGRFIAPKVPKGYELIVHQAPAAGDVRRPQQAQGQQAERR